MIEEHHPMQIGLFPLDIKCHTPQQLQQQQHHQQQLQLQQQQHNHSAAMLMSGNERMLTTPTTAPPTTPTTTTAASTPTPTSTEGILRPVGSGGGHADEQAGIGQGSGGVRGPPAPAAMNGMPATEAPSTAIVNGSCNSHNKTTSNHNNNNNGEDSLHRQASGHDGEPSGCGRVALGECNSNGSATTAGSGLCGTICGGLLGQQQQSLPQHHPHSHHQAQQHSNQHNQQQQLHTGSNGLLCLPPPTAPTHAHTPPALLQRHSGTLAGCSLGDMLAAAAAAGGAVRSIAAGPAVQCGYCCQPICDRYIMRVADTSFHEGCLKCATCSLHLVHSCFARDGKLFCRIDYERLFMRNRCLGCGHKIASDELVMRTHENVFHLKCFACVVCGALLKKGEQYVVKQGQLFCRFDYEKEVEMLQGYEFYGDELFAPKLDGRRGPKRPRTILNTQQRRAFKASFEVSPKPCRKVRENLAKETGLSLRIVQVWFQNQRAKVKKIQKKAKLEHATKNGGSDSQDSQESDSSAMMRTRIKDEAHSDSESLLESPYSICAGSGGGGSGNSSMDAKMRCLLKDESETESGPYNCMETNKENCNKTANEPLLNTILGLSYATFQQLMGPFSQSPSSSSSASSMVNPIDRLYSMQNAYFRPEEVGGGGSAGSGSGGFGDHCGKDAMEN